MPRRRFSNRSLAIAALGAALVVGVSPAIAQTKDHAPVALKSSSKMAQDKAGSESWTYAQPREVFGKYRTLIVDNTAVYNGPDGRRGTPDDVDAILFSGNSGAGTPAKAGYPSIVVPGGFGPRGIEGKVLAAQFAREHKVPYLGLCYGLHMAVIEVARNVCGFAGANSSEIDSNTPHPVIDLMPNQHGVEMGGTMRLGLWPCRLEHGTRAGEAYGETTVYDRFGTIGSE